MRHFAMSVAAVALLAAGGLSAQGNGNGNGKGNASERGGPPAAASNKSGKANDRAGKPDRGPNQARENRRANGQVDRRASSNRGNGNDRAAQNRVERAVAGRIDDRGRNGDRDRNGSDLDRVIGIALNGPDARYGRSGQGLIQGCPPGLAKKRNGCTPPGQAREQRSLFGGSFSPRLFGYSNYGDGRYYYDDGYLVRLGRDGGVSSWLPLLGGALGIGSLWPDGYSSYRAPDYYVDYYGLESGDSYRYADNVIYRVDPETTAIQSVAALLTGDEFVVGQPAPRGYDIYNVPYSYQDRYRDGPNANYRYSDGYLYQIDPETRLVAAAIDLLT